MGSLIPPNIPSLIFYEEYLLCIRGEPDQDQVELNLHRFGSNSMSTVVLLQHQFRPYLKSKENYQSLISLHNSASPTLEF